MKEQIQYLDFEINIDKITDDLFQARINSPGGRAEARFSDPFSTDKRMLYRQTLTTAALRSSARVRSSSTAEVKTMKELGTTLFDQAIRDQVKELYYQCLGQAQQQGKGLRMRLVLDPALSDLPWEFLCTPQKEFLALDPRTPIVRYVELPTPAVPLKADLPLRILVVIAGPKDFQPLDSAAEMQRIDQALKPLQEKGLVQVSFIEGPDTWPRLIDALRPNETHILHFIGHGSFDEKTGEGLLVMEGEDGNARLIGSDRFRILLQGKGSLRLVILNSCLGAQASASEPFSSVAAAMVQAGVPAVIAMQFEVSDDAAKIIAGTFYQSLALNFPVDAALTEARRQIALLDSDSLEWATPVLFMQVPDGHLFDITSKHADAARAVEIPPPTEKPRLISSPYNAMTDAPKDPKPSVDLNQKAEAAYVSGEEAEMRGDWEDAINGYRGALYLVPNYKDAAQKLAYCERRNQCVQLYNNSRELYAKKQYTQVLQTLQQLRGIDPRWVDSADLETLSECGLVYNQALQALQSGDRAKGAELFRKIIAQRSDFEDVVQRLDNLAAGGDGLFGKSVSYSPQQQVEESDEKAFDSIDQAATAPNQDFRIYEKSRLDIQVLAEEIRQFFLREGHQTQIVQQGEAIVIQGQKGGWRRLVGMGQAATVMLENTSEGLKASVGGGKWIEQSAAIAVSMFVLWPLLITGGVGMAQQKQMMDTLWKIIDTYAAKKGARRLR